MAVAFLRVRYVLFPVRRFFNCGSVLFRSFASAAFCILKWDYGLVGLDTESRTALPHLPISDLM
jgi:hypothetical protein